MEEGLDGSGRVQQSIRLDSAIDLRLWASPPLANVPFLYINFSSFSYFGETVIVPPPLPPPPLPLCRCGCRWRRRASDQSSPIDPSVCAAGRWRCAFTSITSRAGRHCSVRLCQEQRTETLKEESRQFHLAHSRNTTHHKSSSWQHSGVAIVVHRLLCVCVCVHLCGCHVFSFCYLPPRFVAACKKAAADINTRHVSTELGGRGGGGGGGGLVLAYYGARLDLCVCEAITRVLHVALLILLLLLLLLVGWTPAVEPDWTVAKGAHTAQLIIIIILKNKNLLLVLTGPPFLCL